jgi:response regulator of citrate/malate metabolism
LKTQIVDTSNRKHGEEPMPPKQQKWEKNPTQLLEKIKESIDRLNEKMEVIIEIQKHTPKETLEDLPDSLDVMTLLSLPDHLRKTAITICKLNQATAEEVAEHTKRARAVESAYLNQLVLMGYLKKERKGRKAYFSVAEK